MKKSIALLVMSAFFFGTTVNAQEVAKQEQKAKTEKSCSKDEKKSCHGEKKGGCCAAKKAAAKS
ncbi:MAG: hypothetical protein U0X58_07600 [Flavobacteriaceae bacterium]|nr:hypothetical protein [Bacteroidota bacterium]